MKWQENGREIDGCTTNGVLIMHPRGSFCGGEAKYGFWLETSVGGGIFSLRESRSAQQRGHQVSIILIEICSCLKLTKSCNLLI